MTSTGRWKRQEREVAALMGSRRNPNTGEHRTDIDAGPFAIEHKARKSLPTWFTAAVEQVARAAPAGKTPLVIVSEVRQGRKAQRYVIWRMEDFVAWHGPASPPVSDTLLIGSEQLFVTAKGLKEEDTMISGEDR